MSGDSIEPKGGMYFNKRLLSEAGIEPQSIYDLQESGDWTWDKFEEICKQIAKDTDNDGVIDRFAMVNFASTFIQEAVWSNNAEFIGKDADGKFINKLETNETLEALNWAVDMLAKYDYPQPDGAEWNYWQEAFVNGAGAFIAGETYQAGQDWKDMRMTSASYASLRDLMQQITLTATMITQSLFLLTTMQTEHGRLPSHTMYGQILFLASRITTEELKASTTASEIQSL